MARTTKFVDTRLGRVRLGEQFADGLADPLETLGVITDRPLPWWGWGSIPDQYGRDWNGDDGETPAPPAPRRANGPPAHPPLGVGSQPWRAQTALPDPVEDGIRYRDLIT